MIHRFLLTSIATSAIALAATAADAQTLQVLRNNALTSVAAGAPGTSTGSVNISGIGAGQTLQGIDYRPASPRMLYSVSNTGQIYAINGRTGSAFAVGSPVAAAATPAGVSAGIDFNPTVDRIRYVTTSRTDLRLNQTNGTLAATDGTLAYAATDANAGQAPVVAGSAYTNNRAGATTTTLYNIDTRGGAAPARLVTQGNTTGTVGPNTGTLFTVGSTGVTTTNAVGFDIGQNGTAYATMTNPQTGVTSLYTVNLQTGSATLVGALAGNTTFTGLAVQLAPLSSFGTTANQAAAGNALDNFNAMINDGTMQMINGIDSFAGSPSTQSALLQALTPAAYQGLTDLSFGVVDAQETTVLRYARDLRGEGQMADGSVVNLDEAGRMAAWMSGGTRFGKTDANTDRYRTQFDSFYFTGGVDYRLAPTTAVGVFGGYNSTNASLTVADRAKGDLKSWYGGAYGTAKVGPVYLDAWGSYSDLDWRLYRALTFGAYSGSTYARTDGRVWAAGAQTGLSLALGAFEIEPFAAVRFADARINGFSETPGAAFALVVDDIRDKSLRTNLGGKIGTKLEIMGATIRPQLRGGWFHEFWPGRRSYGANFQQVGISSTSFQFMPTPFSDDYYNVGGAIAIGGGGPLSAYVDFDYQGDNEREFYNMSVGARFKF